MTTEQLKGLLDLLSTYSIVRFKQGDIEIEFTANAKKIPGEIVEMTEDKTLTNGPFGLKEYTLEELESWST